jgi:FMN phosphatase YigB (HAD superfamily)
VAVRLIIIDLTSGLLTNEEMTAAREGAAEMLKSLSRQYRQAAFVDAPATGLELRNQLEDSGLGGFFERVITSADVGGTLSPAIFRRVAAAVGIPAGQAAVISTQLKVVENLQMAGIVALHAERGRPLSELPEALAWMTAISST